jgi:hypothetical protein
METSPDDLKNAVEERRLPCLGVDGNDYIVIARTEGTGAAATQTFRTIDGQNVIQPFRDLFRIEASGLELICLLKDQT